MASEGERERGRKGGRDNYHVGGRKEGRQRGKVGGKERGVVHENKP